VELTESAKLPLISLIVPVYNEEGILAGAARDMVVGLERLAYPSEVILSENGSVDRTPQLVDELARVDDRIRVLHLPDPDYGQALRQGFLAARGEFLVNFSVDWMDFGFLCTALSMVSEFDLVLASKSVAEKSDSRPWSRRLGGAAFHGLTQWLFGLPVADTHGIKLMRRRLVIGLIERCYFGGEVFDTELVIRAYQAGLRICEIPVKVEERRPSRVGVVKRGWRGLTQLARLRVLLWKELKNT
jgi:glycosyltransferase involved in cell wall biosynthesis